MSLEVSLVMSDEELQLCRKIHPRFRKVLYSDVLKDKAVGNLREAGIEGHVSIDFLRSVSGRLLLGVRLPLVFQLEDGRRVVAKDYQSVNKEGDERTIVQTLNGFCSPKPVFFGSNFYLEELINRQEAKNLAVFFQNNPEEALRAGASVHADLAKRKNIIYGPDKWLHELFLTKDGPKLVDFGTAYFFYEYGKTENKDFKEAVDIVRREGSEFYLVWCAGASFINPHPSQKGWEEHRRAIDKLKDMESEPERAVNSYFAIRDALCGVRDSLFDIYDDTQVEKVFGKMRNIAPCFVSAFADAYSDSS